jgi:hypothetical protein
MRRVHVGALIGFNYHGKRKGFPQLMYFGEKYSQMMNIQDNYENFLTKFWYLNTSLLVSLAFIPDYWLLIVMN